MTDFVKKASSCKMCDFWENEDDLSTKVAIALPKIFRKTPGVGWVRGDQAISPQVSEELALLSKENRDIRLENQHLQQLIGNRTPDITATLNGKTSIEFAFIEADSLTIDFHGNKRPFKALEYPEKIVIQTIPEHLKPFLDHSNYSKIHEYNDCLPAKEVMDEYNYCRELYFRMKGTAIDLDLVIENSGNTKANEIHIDLKFPDLVGVMHSSDIESFDFPKSPIPKNPLNVAEEEYQKEQKRKLTPFAISNFSDQIRDLSHFSIPGSSRTWQDTIAGLDINNEVTSDYDLETRILSARIKSLLHTRKISINKYFIFALRRGEANIDVSIVCEEYQKPAFASIPLIVK